MVAVKPYPGKGLKIPFSLNTKEVYTVK